MVFIKNPIHEFYSKIQNERVVVFVALDVDSLCACKILQYLFQCDQVLYTVIPVADSKSLFTEFRDNCIDSESKCVLLLNCGASFDVVENIDSQNEKATFFICDSHRPIEIHNIYDLVQVKLLIDESEVSGIPAYDSVFCEDEEVEDMQSDSEAESSEDEGVHNVDSDVTHEINGESNNVDSSISDENKENLAPEKTEQQTRKLTRIEKHLRRVEKQRKRRLWDEKRDKILFEYMQFSNCGTSVAYTMYKLAWKLSRDTNDLLWLAIIGVTDQYLHHRISWEQYFTQIEELQHHVSRHNRFDDDNEMMFSIDCLKIRFEEELWLTLYRHWDLFTSLCHTISPACIFRLWTLKGRKKLHEFLADMGLPLAQCHQRYSSMEKTFRNEMVTLIREHSEKYGFLERDLFIPSFNAQYGYKNRYCAADVVYSCVSILEPTSDIEGGTSSDGSFFSSNNPDKDHYNVDSFLRAMNVLTRNNVSLMQKGIELAKSQCEAMVNQITSLLDLQLIMSAGPFLYCLLEHGSANSALFSYPQSLQRLARFILEAFCSVFTGRARKTRTLPLILGAITSAATTTVDDDHNSHHTTSDSTSLLLNDKINDISTNDKKTENHFLTIIGIPPLSEKTGRNFFGKAFEQAANAAKIEIHHDFFDRHIVKIRVEDKSRFFDALITILV